MAAFLRHDKHKLSDQPTLRGKGAQCSLWLERSCFAPETRVWLNSQTVTGPGPCEKQAAKHTRGRFPPHPLSQSQSPSRKATKERAWSPASHPPSRVKRTHNTFVPKTHSGPKAPHSARPDCRATEVHVSALGSRRAGTQAALRWNKQPIRSQSGQVLGCAEPKLTSQGSALHAW